MNRKTPSFGGSRFGRSWGRGLPRFVVTLADGRALSVPAVSPVAAVLTAADMAGNQRTREVGMVRAVRPA